MAGRAEPAVIDVAESLNTWVLNEHDTWSVAAEPLHYDRPDRVGVGPGLSFVRAVRGYYGDRDVIGVVPAARGNTSIDDWQPEAWALQDALRRVELVRGGRAVDGVLWHQGEQDAEAMASEVYQERLFHTMGAFRSALGPVPIVVGELGRFIPGAPAIDRALASFVEEVPGTRLVSTEGLTSHDGLHFDAPSTRTLGLRYARAFVSLLSEPGGSVARPGP